jgi:hypothetical protein
MQKQQSPQPKEQKPKGQWEYLAYLEDCEKLYKNLTKDYITTYKYIKMILILIVSSILFTLCLIKYEIIFDNEIALYLFIILISVSIINFTSILSNMYTTKYLVLRTKQIIINNDIRSIPLILSIVQLRSMNPKYKSIFYESLASLLYAINEAASKDQFVWTKRDVKHLQQLAQDAKVARQYPDTVGGALVVLRMLGGEENKRVVDAIAQRKPRHTNEAWLPQAAQACLDEWKH